MNLFSLKGKTSIVTGAGRGIGRSVALGLAEAGSNVVVCSRTTTELEELAAEIEAKGVEALVAPCDVSKEGDIDRVINQTLEKFNSIDILINNAGVTKKHPAEDFPAEDWNQIISVNLTGVFQFAQKVGKVMIEQGSGSIVNVSSVASQTAIKKSIAYAASKGGVNMLTKNFAAEWADKGVRVNGIAPAYIETPLVEAVKNHRKGFADDIANRTPMGRMGRPDELIGAAIFLASDASSYITGETIFVDGGWTALGL
jgi:NAD(P)-dependent dehydrogenase (short-subunit alcohol dehydrogenase family)